MTVGYDAFYGTKITDDCLIADTVSFDEETGVLTLLPCHINKEDVRAYADNEAVKSVVAAEGAILPEDPSYLFAELDPSSLTAVAFKTNLVSIDLSKADTSNVTDMQRIFSSLKALTSLDISGFDTSEVTDMSDIFLESNALTSLDLSSFDTSKVNNTSWMFNSCQKLKTIYVSDKWNTAAITMSGSMFSGCKALVGGNGTVYDSTNVDAKYARIDKEGQKGYLTMSANTAYDLTVAGSKVTYGNKGDILGDGSVLYNGVNLVISKDIDLSKYTNAYIGTTEDYKGFMGSDQIGIQIAADVTLKGYISTTADLTIFGGHKLTIESSKLNTIYTSGNNIKISEVEIVANASFRNNGGEATLTIEKADVTCASYKSQNSSATVSAITGFNGGVTLTDCKLITPEGGKFVDGTIYEADGTTKYTGEVVIGVPKPTVSFDAETGVLTLLKGNVVKDEVQAYANNEAVKSVVAEEGAVLPEDCSAMFKNFKATSIDLTNANTSNVTGMSCMFMQCYELTDLNLSGIDTSEV
ncbi:MAG: BspA family leucine-rich repeat surface protein, partial [Ruminococcus sp.]|nr:BspA family leucine-rich repeat surface protein [Ruminococcus sp.]